MSAATIDWDTAPRDERDRAALAALTKMRRAAVQGSEEFEALLHAAVVLTLRVEDRAAKAAGARA